MPQQLPLQHRVSQSSQAKITNRVRQAQFGDGYDHTMPDGINNIVAEWSITYSILNQAEFNTLRSFLTAIGSWDFFTWQPPTATAVQKFKVTPDGYTVTARSGDVYDLSFSAKQVF